MRHQRKPAKVRVGKTSVPVPDIPLQEPILITDLGKELVNLCLLVNMKFEFHWKIGGHSLIKQTQLGLSEKDVHWSKQSEIRLQLNAIFHSLLTLELFCPFSITKSFLFMQELYKLYQ